MPTPDSRLNRAQYPRASSYDPALVLENLMGPNVLWLTESLTQVIDLQPGMRVLDLGCGKAISSIFLAREFDVQVWAAELWIKPSENWDRIREAGFHDSVFPISVEAHAMPFAAEFFDAIVSFDAYHYFGTDNLYLSSCARFLKPGGLLGIVVPGLKREFTAGLPVHLDPFWHPDFWSFHSPEWWSTHWQQSEIVDILHADQVPDGWRDWLDWLELCAELGYRSDPQEAEMVRIDAGRNLGFSRIAARKRAAQAAT